jgi:dTDP-4-amino-4,6-dideoxygalactose transaminase
MADIEGVKDIKKHCRAKLKELAGKKELYFTLRCNRAIEIAVQITAKHQDAKILLIQEEGGWLSYDKQAKKNNLELIYLPMQEGKIDKNELAKYKDRKAILLMHSMPGYSYAEDMEELYDSCRKNNIILINDCCGSIGTPSAAIGDIIVCSFGEAKPLSAGGGGFIAADDFTAFGSKDSKTLLTLLSGAENDAAAKINFDKLALQIDSLQERLLRWHKKAKEVKFDLSRLGTLILNPGSGGINVLAAFSNDEEKERLINYCKEKGVEFTECPRYIRTNKKAISIEIKRLD